MATTDPHDRLLTKAFGDLTRRPFAWCFEPPQEGDEGYVSLDELFFLLSEGAVGSPPKDWPESQQQTTQQK